MKMPGKGEKGFTLIELLIVVAILGVLAAIVIPNVGRFIGEGESEAAATEFQTIQSAVHSMMVDNEVQSLSNPVASPGTANMNAFPDTTTADQLVLYGCNVSGTIVNYVATNTTSYLYYVDSIGTVTQGAEAP